jgi:hypothetical protein
MAATTSCVSCKAPFPANRELATIPDADRIAFDPAHRRVWRICARCGEWNLLGAEASERALPELEARFAAAPKRAGGEGFAPAHVGSALELLQIGATMAVANESAMRKRRWQLALLKWTTGPVVAALLLTLVGLEVWVDRDPASTLHGAYALLVSYPIVILVYANVRRRFRLPVNRLLVVLAVVVGLGGLVINASQSRWGLIAWLPAMAIAAIVAFTMRPISYLTAYTDSGEELRIYSRHDLKEMSMSWNMADGLTLHGFPNGAVVSGNAAIAPLQKVLKGRNIVFVRGSVSDAAYDLVRTAGGLPGVLRALEGFRQDNSGRVVLADLPKVYIVALDLALAEWVAGDDSDHDDDIAALSVPAAEIAAEAEALDRAMSR